jgi:hypothetical protein
MAENYTVRVAVSVGIAGNLLTHTEIDYFDYAEGMAPADVFDRVGQAIVKGGEQIADMVAVDASVEAYAADALRRMADAVAEIARDGGGPLPGQDDDGNWIVGSRQEIDCDCVEDCGEGDGCDGEHTFEDDCTACSQVGTLHSHDDDPCPAHPERVVG